MVPIRFEITSGIWVEMEIVVMAAELTIILAMDVFRPSNSSCPRRVTEFQAPRETSSQILPQRKSRSRSFISGRSFLVKVRFAMA